jgi:hypothetical protein
MDLYRVILSCAAVLILLYGLCSSGLYEDFDDAMSGVPDALAIGTSQTSYKENRNPTFSPMTKLPSLLR